MTKTGGKILVESLIALGVHRVFAVPGESYLAVLDALYDHPEIELITTRHESGAAMMAEAHGKLTGQPGICFVTRGPGATNASTGVHIAGQDSSPLILFIGQVATDMIEREAFQEIEYRRFFAPICKWASQIDDPARISEYINRAYHTSGNGRPGPVALALPENTLSANTSMQPLPWVSSNHNGLDSSSIEQLTDELQRAKNPLVLTGRAGWSDEATQALQLFARKNNIPVAATFRCQDTFDNRHPNYIGDVGIGINPKLAAAVKQADTLLVIGARLGEMTTGGYSLIDLPVPQQRLIHVYPGAEELNRSYGAHLALNCDVTSFCRHLESIELNHKPDIETLKQYNANYVEWNTPLNTDHSIELSQIVNWLSQHLPDSAIITNGAGNYASWIHRFFQFKQFHTQIAPTSGSMGYGLPGALAAKAQHRDRTVVCFAGDGCLQMTIQELATAIQFKLNIIVILVNNGSWGTIRMHQEMNYPERKKGTDLINPDFTALAKAYGLNTESVSSHAQFCQAFTNAEQSQVASLIEIKHPVERITPTKTLSELKTSP